MIKTVLRRSAPGLWPVCGLLFVLPLIDACGRLHEVYFPGTKDIYGAGFKLVRVPLRQRGESRSLTFYHRYGDWFGWSCVGVTAVQLLRKGFQKSLER